MKIVIGECDLSWWSMSSSIFITPSLFVSWGSGTVHDLDEDVIKKHIEIEVSFDFIFLRSFFVIHIMY